MPYNIREARGVVPMYQFMSDDGLPTGNVEMTGDYSVTAGTFYVQPPLGTKMRIDSLVVQLRDNGNIDAGNYGNSVVLTNGIQIVLGAPALTVIELDLIPGNPVKTTADWTKFGATVALSAFGQGDNFIAVEYKLPAPFILEGNLQQAFGFILNDDYSNLVSHTGFVAGWQSP